MVTKDNHTRSNSEEHGLLSQSRRGVLKLTGGGLGAMAVGGTLLGSATAETADGNCVQVDFVTGTSAISDLSSSTYSGNSRLIQTKWGETVDNDTENANETVDRTSYVDTCTVDTSSDLSIDFASETASVSYTLSNCGGSDQDLLLVSYESPCNGAAGSGGQWDPANADQQAVFDTATATTQSDGSLTVDVPPLPAGVPQRSSVEAYYSLDGTAGTNCTTGADADLSIGANAPPADGQPGVSDNTNDAFEFSYDGTDSGTVQDALVSGNQLDINGAQFTIAGWVYHTGHDATGGIFQAGGTPSNRPDNGMSLEFVWDSSTYDYSGPGSASDAEQVVPVIWEFGGNTTNEAKSLPVAFDAWRFVALAVNGDDHRLHVYDTNGEISDSPTTVTASRGQTSSASLVCMAGDGWDVAGRLDEVYAYSTELSASEIQTLYDNSF